MTNTSQGSPSVLLVTLDSLPFSERPRYLARLSTSQRRELRTYVDQLTNAPPSAAGAGRYQSERLAVMMALDALEQGESGSGGAVPPQAKKGLNGLALGALAASVVVIVLAVASAESGSEARGTRASARPSSPAPSEGIRSSQRSTSWLRAEIDAGRTQLRSLESRLRNIKLELDLLESQMSSYQAEIDRHERNARLGLNESGYRAALDNYNALVPRYNLQLQTYNSRYAEYEGVLNRMNALIDEYNARRRR